MNHPTTEPERQPTMIADRLAHEIKRLRNAAGLSQRVLASKIGYSRQYVTMTEWEDSTLPSHELVAAIDAALGADGQLVALRQRADVERRSLRDQEVDNKQHISLRAGTRTTIADADMVWRSVRGTLNAHRHTLNSLVEPLYRDAVRIEGTTCLSCPSWLAPEPVELHTIQLGFESDTTPPLLDGSEPETAACRAPRSADNRYRRYSQAVREIAKPSLFENRISYRLLDASLAAENRYMRFGLTTYFDMVDTSEVLAHETAAAWMSLRTPDQRISMDHLPFRRLVGDLFDLTRRPVLPSINTLTIRRAPDGDTFFLHRRDATKVATAAGLTHVIPAGVFQPAAIGRANVMHDFSLWRNMLREFSEEFLDTPEHDGSSGAPVDYNEEPFQTLNEGVRTSDVKAWCFGIGLDPMTPAGEILTTAVIDSAVFDTAFAQIVAHNAEGDVYPSDYGTVGIRWTPTNVRYALDHEPLAPAAAACLALTWRHRDLLLPARES
ncbi:helix-turn-helix transcriptional regulator [Nocardia sp. BMG51109]|uniref:helix-turn-helix domain-containing protein n=1 Tax=Nocardia sp. BMG51109 TaxID=1056816 RepID=UPI0004669E72|nr:helix-turn-helix transcriptional regulator [Nocardia sp. BMG51109]